MTSYTATIAFTLAALGMSVANAGEAQRNVDAAAKQALVAEMGELAKDLTVAVDSQGVATLGGWTKEPKEANKARYIVSQVPGVTKAYSTGVHTWSATDTYK